MDKNSFVLMKDRLDEVMYLTDEQAGRLFKSIYLFENEEEPLELDQLTTLLFMGFKRQLEANDAKWDEVRRRRSENGRKGGRGNKANKANAFSEKQTKANKAVTVTGTVTGTDTVVEGNTPTYSPTNYTLTAQEIRTLSDEFEPELVNWGLKRMDDYLQRNPDKTFASYYQTVADWIRQEMVKRAKEEDNGKSIDEWFLSLTDEERNKW